MSAKDAGTPFADKAEGLEKQLAPNSVIMPQNATNAQQFPTDALGKEDERDKIMSLKAALTQPAAGGDGIGGTQFGKMKLQEADLKWIEKKQKEAEEANFQQWFALEFDRMNPADKQAAKKLFPEFYAQRKRLIRKQAKNLAHISRIRLTGPESLKDLMYMWLADQGRLDLGALQNLMTPRDDFDDPSDVRFVRGLFNPARPQPKTGNQPFRDGQYGLWNQDNTLPGARNARQNYGFGAGFGNFAANTAPALVANNLQNIAQ